MEEIVGKPRALIVDDELPARLRLRELLERSQSVVVCGECASGGDAVDVICELRPELLLIDVQMPVMDGFQVLRQLPSDQLPVTIFVTAYDRYALAAFEAHAFDYLLKPFSDERFTMALDRAMKQIGMRQNEEIGNRILAMLDSGIGANRNERTPPGNDRLTIKVNGRVVILKTGDVDWVEAAGVYVELHAGKKVYLHRASITEMEGQLVSARFVRIHRSTLVNLDRVRELRPATHGEFHVLLSDGRELKLSRGYRHRLEEQLGRSL
ncbi:Two component transcriptional regulator, LytTR family [Candidatus Sulfopaludibacter sp. SbA3]|nr:Two component transcriptional regulator, LytTR family [Candidatus Sulfopaludibacter sp. SbA3]